MIDILMATYNGEINLDTQIASIINQSYKDWFLYIHDDGSTDNTVSIIKKWAGIDNRIKIINDGFSYHNSGRNFLELLKYSSNNYICFADQDDYWLDNKLEIMLSMFPKGITTPHLLNTASFLWNPETERITFDTSFKCPTKLEQVFFRNGGLQGCCLMFNSSLRDLIVQEMVENCTMHDLYITLLAYCFGSVSHFRRGLILYRNHQNTVTIHPVQTKREKVVRIFNNRSPVVTKSAYNDIRKFFEVYSGVLNNEQKRLFEKYLCLPDCSSLKRLLMVLFSHLSLNEHGRIKLLFKLLMRPYFG